MAAAGMNDAFVVGEEWISEHYFTTDGKQSFQSKVNDRRKEWDEAAKAGKHTSRSRFIAARGSILSTLAAFGDDGGRFATLPDLYSTLRTALGFDAVALQSKRSGPVEWVHTTGLEHDAPLAIVEAIAVKDVETLLAKGDPMRPAPRDCTLLEPYDVDEKSRIHSVARLLSHLFVADNAPEFVLVLAGGWLLIAEKERWPEGRYLAVNLQLVAERADDKRGGETDRALTCIDAQSLAPDADGNLWWPEILKESINHTVGVSKDLREGVRLSIELIANEVVRRRAAEGLDPLPQSQAQDLARDALRYLYRILFLLFAEASPELGVLPVGDPTYERGYSLDRLRELTLVEIAGPRAEDGTHLYESLATLFRLVDRGHDGARIGDDDAVGTEGLTFQPLRADLFLPKATSRIDAVGLGNKALQRVLRHLLLSKESKGRDRGFISYAELGINQLGAVYEGLMSYTGFFAEEDLHEVAKGGDNEKGSWVVPVTRSQSISPNDFVKAIDEHTGEEKPVLHEAGTFVYRLAGRERQQSASYYTPEVLTRFTVGQALVELIGPDRVDPDSVEWKDREIPRRLTAREILDLTVCEPALGSGAFAIEATRQLADAYLKRRQEELGERIDPDAYPTELQKVKSYIALHNVYGVDLNSTAVELAEISLWLDTMGKDLDAPWFGLHLKRGNSLIGARRALFRTDQVTSKAYLGKSAAIPKDVPLSEDAAGIHHFLVPADGWGSAVDAKEAKELAPDALALLKDWQKKVRVKLSKQQVKDLESLSRRVETLWGFATARLRIAESEIRRGVNVWGADDLPNGGAVTREQIEASLKDARGAYQRLHRVMDAWCALWFWPLTEKLATVTFDDGDGVIDPPTLDEWIGGLKAVLGTHYEAGATGSRRTWRGGNQTLVDTDTWEELGAAEELDLGFAGASVPERFLDDYPWLVVADRIAKQQGFFHWELDFAAVFADRGGFDLQVGNPPWVRPTEDNDALLAEGDPWWQLRGKSTPDEERRRRAIALAAPGVADLLVDVPADAAGVKAFLGSFQAFPELTGLQADLYRCFIVHAWRLANDAGVSALVHPDSHFTDDGATDLRRAVYRHLRRSWVFANRLNLFEDVGALKTFGVHVYGLQKSSPAFVFASSIYDPSTVLASLRHDGSGPEPGMKDDEGRWDLRPHANRVVRVTLDRLAGWAAFLQEDETPGGSKLVYVSNRTTANVIGQIGRTTRLSSLALETSSGWHEKNDKSRGYFSAKWGVAESWEKTILLGPNIHILNPLFKAPNSTMSSKSDWTDIDLESLPADALPVTSYKPTDDTARYDRDYTAWTGEFGPVSSRSSYRIAWRRRTDNVGSRSLLPTMIPPGAAHVDPVVTMGSPRVPMARQIAALGGMSSLLGDLAIRSVPKGDIRFTAVTRVPLLPEGSPLVPFLALRVLRLTAITSAYSTLWSENYVPSFSADSWTDGGYASRITLGDVGPAWGLRTPLRVARDRRQALLEIDAIVALGAGVSIDDLCSVYRSEFPVQRGYDDRKQYYDANGRMVPTSVLNTWRTRGQNDGAFAATDLCAIHPGSGISYTFELPFAVLGREVDLRNAYAEFQRRLAGTGGAL